jgi:M6 family metalloprotease-like protein
VSGPKPLLVILVSFNDIEVKTGAAAHWSDALFRAGGRSVADFYRDNSYGKVTVIAVPHTQAGSPPGVVTISLPQKHPDYGNRGTYAAESEWVNKALAAAAAHVDFARLDTNADGTIEVDEALVYFILAGHEMSGGSGLRPWIWAHRWGGPGVGVGGKKIDNWALNGEMYNATERMQIGVIAHEVGHAMGGLPDLYDISNTNAGLGGFSVMSSGSWGSRPGETQGATPVGMDAWSRQYLGWSAPRYPAASGSITFTSAFSGSNSAVMLMNPAISTSEYWLVENRAPVGWDAGLSRWLGSWKGGLLVQHVDTMIGTQHANSFNKYVARSHQGNVAVEPSTAKCRMLKPKGSAGCETILFFSGNAILFDGTSTPGSKFYSGKASALGVSNVSVPGPSMTATITR